MTDPDLATEDVAPDDPFADDLADRLAALAPRPAGRVRLALVGLVVLVAGFLGGVLVQKNFGAAAAANATGNLPAGAVRGGPGPGNQNPDATITTGTVKLVDGSTVYITLSTGETVTVKTSDRTTVAIREAAALADLEVGQRVAVEGTSGSDGVVTATAVTAEK